MVLFEFHIKRGAMYKNMYKIIIQQCIINVTDIYYLFIYLLLSVSLKGESQMREIRVIEIKFRGK